MKVKVLLVAAAMLLFAATGYCQLMSFSFANVPEGDGTQLSKTCGGTDYMHDGEGRVVIYQDMDPAGYGDEDRPLVLCGHAPVCTPPDIAGTFNMNTFYMNGEEGGYGEPGWFTTDYAGAFATMPPAPLRFYARVFYPATGQPTIEWHSGIVTDMTAAQPYDRYLTGWVCRTLVIPCETHAPVTIAAGAVGAHNTVVCDLNVCANTPLVVMVGPVPQMDRIPHVIVTPCPTLGATGISTSWNGYTGWTWYEDPISHLFYYKGTVTVTGNGCVCLSYDNLLPSELNGELGKAVTENSVTLTWSTNSETAINRFEVRRDGALVKTIPAHNVATGSDYSFVDENLTAGTIYNYEMKLVRFDNSSVVLTTSASPSMEAATVTEYALRQNYPNPFNPNTRIAFDVKADNNVTLTVYNATGQEVASLLSNVSFKTGRHAINFDATNLTSGLYFYTIKIGNEFSATKKMLLVK